jgi:raffinose/stachyose/melibiose transport system substrate-binding protein
LLIFVFALALSGCSSSSTSTPAANTGKEGTASKEQVTLDINVVDTTKGDETQLKTWTQIVDNYTKKNPNVKINLKMEALTGDTWRTWVSTQLIGGTAPDIFTTRIIWDHEDLAKGLLLDLTPYLKEKTPYNNNEVWESTISEPILNQMKNPKGQYAGVPKSVNMVRILYNKDLFKKAGITDLPKTWNEFMAAHEKLKTAGITPFVFPNSGLNDNVYNWVERIFTDEITDFAKFDEIKNNAFDLNEYVKGVDTGTIDPSKSPYKEVFPIIKDWSKYWNKGYNGLDYQTATDLFLKGDAAMIFGHMNNYKTIFTSSARKFEIGAFPLPYLTKENHPNASGVLAELGTVPQNPFVIPAKIDKKKIPAAIDFIKYTSSPEVQSLKADALYEGSIIKNVQMPDKLKDFRLVGREEKFKLYSPEFDKNVSEVSVKLGQLYLEGSMPLDEYVKKMSEAMNAGVKAKMKELKMNPENNYGIEK